MSEPLVSVRDLTFRRPGGAFELRVPEFDAVDGEHIALTGPSGSGKTTLLHLIAGILLPQQGSIRVAGLDIHRLNDARRRAFRIAEVGFVFQDFELIEYLNVRENILLPYLINRRQKATAADRERVRELAGRAGLADKLRRNVMRLSQGEKQRVGVCRALVTQPRLILADEPTGNLDPATKVRIVDLLREEAEKSGAGLLMVTHDTALTERFPRTVDFAHLAAPAGEAV